MPSNDAPVSDFDKTRSDRSVDTATSQRLYDDVRDAKKKDSYLAREQSSRDPLSTSLRDQGILPELTIVPLDWGSGSGTTSSGGVEKFDSNGHHESSRGRVDERVDGRVMGDQGGSEMPDSAHKTDDSQKSQSPITTDTLGRVTEVKNADGSTTSINYDGSDSSPSRVTITYGDGTTATYERDGQGWKETVQPVGGAPQVSENIDSVTVSDRGDVTSIAGSVTEVRHQNGSVDVIAEHADGSTTKAHYQYDADGEVSFVSRTNPDGTVERFSTNRLTGEMERTTYDQNGKRVGSAPISNLEINFDGGISYDSGQAHVVVEGYGASHITETTSYGTYEQSFDPSGNLTTIVRTDTASGTTELITNIDGDRQTLLVYPTGCPEAYTTPAVTVNLDGSYSYTDAATGATVDRGVDFTDNVLRLTPFDPKITSVATENGVTVTRSVENGKFVYQYSVEACGETIPILTSDGDPEADSAKLLELRNEKLAALEEDYNIKIGRDGEFTDVDGEQVPLMTPNLGQLYGVEAAVERSAPDVVRADGKPVEVDFLARQGKNPSKGGFADGSRVVIEPNGGISTPEQVMRVFMHELAHNGQYHLYGDDETYQTAYAAQLGYVKAGDDWLLVTKDGQYFKSIPNPSGVGSSGWERTDKDGNPLDANGNPSEDPQIITNEEAADLALVKPATGYFPNPAEAGAEATAIFRSGEQRRSELLATNPELYDVIKRLDQLDINKTYGLDEAGEPKFIRSPEGLIVPNTPENRAAVNEFEKSATAWPLGNLGGVLGKVSQPAGKTDPDKDKSENSLGRSNIEFIPALTLVY